MQHLDLTDEEAAALIKELGDITRERSLPVLIAHPDPEGDPGQAATRAGARALAAAQGVRSAASNGCQRTARLGQRKGGDMAEDTTQRIEAQIREFKWRARRREGYGITTVSTMKPDCGPMTLGNAAAAKVRLIVWCKTWQHQVEPDPDEMAARYGADTSVLDWRERLVCSECGGRLAAFRPQSPRPD
jgi:hypothetical protein